MFYVYEHWRPDKNEPFYVGKGRKHRAGMMARRNPHHKAILEKLRRLGLSAEVKIVARDLSEDEAFKLEKELISAWRLKNIDLTNMTDGGEGPAGRPALRGEKHPMFGKPSPRRGVKMTPEQREKVSLAMMGKKNRLGAILSEETKAKISKAHLARESKPTGIPLSPERRAKISVSVSKSIMGEKNPFWGRSHSEETKAKISATKKRQKCHMPA